MLSDRFQEKRLGGCHSSSPTSNPIEEKMHKTKKISVVDLGTGFFPSSLQVKALAGFYEYCGSKTACPGAKGTCINVRVGSVEGICMPFGAGCVNTANCLGGKTTSNKPCNTSSGPGC